MNKPLVLGIGELLWDVFSEKKVLGGAPANFAYHASQLGCCGYVLSATGKDNLGQEIINQLSEKKLNNLIEMVDFPTGTVRVTLDEQGVPQYEICENVAWDNIPFSEKAKELAENCSAVCFGSLAQRSKVSRDTIQKLLSFVPDSAYRIFDINLRQHFYNKEIIHQSLLNSNVLKVNDDEITVLAQMHGLQEFAEPEICMQLLEMYNLDIVIETKGAVGSYVMDNNEVSWLDTPKVEVVDTVGAGDAFTGAFVSAMLQGKTLLEAHQLAVKVSAYICMQRGAMPVLSDEYEKIILQ